MKVVLELFRNVPMSRPRDRKPRWRLAVGGALAGVVMVFASELFSLAPNAVNQFYTNGLSSWFTRALGSLSGAVGFSVVELLMVALALWFFVPGVFAWLSVLQRTRHAANAFACGLARVAGMVGFLIATFYLLWGFNYASPNLPARLGWDDSSLASLPRMGTAEDREELARLCTQLVFVTNYHYEQAMGSRDAGVHSHPRASIGEIDRSIEEGYARAARLLGLDDSFAQSRGPIKEVYAARLMSRLGIAGFYSPWTGEANYNSETPPFQQMMTIAHEKAHQRCVTSEDEANFLGFLACVLSDDPYVRYSGYLFAQWQLMRELKRVDPDAARRIAALRCKGVQRDVYYSHAYWSVFQGPVQKVSLAVNNAFLKANRVNGGLLSYQMSARLIVLFSRYNEGTCVVTPQELVALAHAS